jgi:hypothetical protein
MKILLPFAIVFFAQFFLSSNTSANSLAAEIERLKDQGVKCEFEQNFKSIDGKPESWICYQSSGKVMFKLKVNSKKASKIKSISVKNFDIETEDTDSIAKNWVKIIAETYGKPKSTQIIDAFSKGERGEVETDQFIFVIRSGKMGALKSGKNIGPRTLKVLAK